MSKVIRPIAEIDRQAREILTRDLGVVDTLRFLGQFRSGTGNYTAERREWLDDVSLQDIISEIKGKRRKARGSKKSG
jgi:hypothetical protein